MKAWKLPGSICAGPAQRRGAERGADDAFSEMDTGRYTDEGR